MKRIMKNLAAAVLIFLSLAGFGQPAYAQTGSNTDKITLVYTNGKEKTYTLDEMRSAVKGTVVLLRDSCLDDDAGCDMTIVYNAMDFAFLKGAMKAIIPLTTAQYNTIQNVWLKNDFFEQLYPTVEQDLFRADLASDGRYTISFGFNVNARVKDQNSYDEAMMKKFMSARDKALKIVAGIPGSCNTDYEKLEYLYDYLTSQVIYYDFDKHGNQYWNSGDVVCLLYDALIRHETVCAGYAYSFAYLCELAGIDAQYVTTWTGSKNDPSHEVVIAEADGVYHWFDATWDCDNYQSGFRFFGLSETEFQKRHTYPKTYYARSLYPSCPSSLETPTGYWDVNTKKYHLRASAGLPDAGIREGRYSIVSALDSRMVLEIDGFSTENGGNAQIYENGYIDFQKFDVFKDAGGYGFRNCGSSLMLDVYMADTASGTNVWQYKSNSSDAQRWSVKDAGNGYCYIKSNLGELYLEVAGSRTANRTNVQVASFTGKDNQKWKMNLAIGKDSVNLKEGRYSITSALNSRMVLEVGGFSTENGGNVQIYENGFIDFQKFDLIKDAGGYGLRNCGSSLMMDVQGGTGSSGSNVWQYQGNSTDAQRWSIENAGNGYYYIKSFLGEYYLEVAGSSTANCTNVQIADFTGKDNQKWKFN